MIKTIFASLFILLALKIQSQHILLAEKWHPKIYKALELVQQNVPAIFKTIETAYIQAGEIRCQQMNAFAQMEYRNQLVIPWIIIDREALDEFNYKVTASILLHEALHLIIWDHGNGKSWGDMSLQEQKKENSYIFNYQIAFLKKVHASRSDINYFETIMNQIGIK